MNTDAISVRMSFARDLVREAGQLALSFQSTPSELAIDAKGPRDFVTAADKAVETLIAERLAQQFGDVILGEEFGGDANASALWIVDPIDGTYNYMHANPRWCVSLGFVIDGRPELGFIYAPQRDVFYEARRGGGAFCNGKTLSVSSARYASAPLVEVGCSSRRPLSTYLSLVETLMTDGVETRRLGSGALALADVATGETDGTIETHINSWDVAAGLLLVTEAGGRVNDFFAGDGVRSGNPILAASPWLFERLAKLSGVAL